MSMQEKRKKVMPFGISDFAEIIQSKRYYVDKSPILFEIGEEKGSKTTLFARPRRFGKTTLMSMLSYFFNIEAKNLAPKLFAELEVSKNTEFCNKYMNQFPIIFWSLKKITYASNESFYTEFAAFVAMEYNKYSFLLSSNKLNKGQKEKFTDYLNEKKDINDLSLSLSFLVSLLYTHYEAQVVVLIDEYDAPILSAFVSGHYDDCIPKMRRFFEPLKDNVSIYRSILTGILRISRESIFSELNHLEVDTIFDEKFATYFGFTQQEINTILEYYEVEQHKEQVALWYNGYSFGNQKSIYNPWSIINWLNTPAKDFAPYWVNTSSNDLPRHLFVQNSSFFFEKLTTFMNGGELTTTINQNLKLPDLNVNNKEMHASLSNLLSLFAQTGYLTVSGKENRFGKIYFNLKIPNFEVKEVFTQMLQDWLLHVSPMAVQLSPELLLNDLIKGDLKNIEYNLNLLMSKSTSYYDFITERNYHCFLLGFFVWLCAAFSVKSNYESGQGRLDIALVPNYPNIPCYVMELKVLKKVVNRTKPTIKEINSALTKALKQIQDKEYVQGLSAKGKHRVIHVGIVCFKKKLWMKAVEVF